MGGEHRCPQHKYLPTCEGTVGSPWLGELIRILLFSGLLKERGIQTFAGRYFIFTTFSQLVKIVARRSFLARSAHSRLGSPGSHGSGFRSPRWPPWGRGMGQSPASHPSPSGRGPGAAVLMQIYNLSHLTLAWEGTLGALLVGNGGATCQVSPPATSTSWPSY